VNTVPPRVVSIPPRRPFSDYPFSTTICVHL
jgi:hypothetical protein